MSAETCVPKLPKNGTRWGDWRLDTTPPASLDYVPHRHSIYWVRLSDLSTWAGFNHWMHHLVEKNWGRDSIGDFVTAVLACVRLDYPRD